MDTTEIEIRKRKNIDERKAFRRSCVIPADFSVKNRACLGVVTNISPFGVFIKSLDIFQADETVKIVIKTKNANVKRTGTISWSNQTGFGLQFANI